MVLIIIGFLGAGAFLTKVGMSLAVEWLKETKKNIK